MNVKFDHSKNRHSVQGAKTAINAIFGKNIPKSVLDVGCGVGAWLKAFEELGVKEIEGVDGVDLPKNQLLIEKSKIKVLDLVQPINLKRKYDLVLCLEVGEHIEKKHSSTIIDSLTRHGDFILFSGAIPGQAGQNHINCQWPSFWQKKFNSKGFACYDFARFKIWDEKAIEPWYRQNIFVAKKSKKSGNENRIISILHPEIFEQAIICETKIKENIRKGSQPIHWYVTTAVSALACKIKRKLIKKY